jgi:miniconductance mechanosensitive channel
MKAFWDWIVVFAETYSLLPWLKLVIILVGAWVFFLLTRKILIAITQGAVERTKNKWDDYLYKKGFFNRLSLFVPLVLIYATAGWPGLFEELLRKICMVSMVLVGARVMSLFLESFLTMLQKKQDKSHSISGIIQAAKLLIYLIGFILAAALIMDRSPLALLSGIGAMTAILTLVFKDTILSLVASIQFSLNKTLKVGDWIEVPEVGADGDVVDITLHNVMVQNWDKTLITIPTHKFLELGFKNWKGMADAGGRRIKRSLLIDLHSVEFLTPRKLAELKKIQLIKEYIEARDLEIDSFNKEKQADRCLPVNGRNQTNLGVFRIYTEQYLKSLSVLRQDMTLMVRQLEPGDKGIPIQIYCFTADTVWANYEAIQADIFDHLIAAVPWFGLRLHQNPGSGDLAGLLHAGADSD